MDREYAALYNNYKSAWQVISKDGDADCWSVAVPDAGNKTNAVRIAEALNGK
jgi:hypothetical protein